MITFKISSTAMSTIEGSEIYSDAEKYVGKDSPDLPAAVDAVAALRAAPRVKFGRGFSYVVETTPEAAALIVGYCDTVGSTFAAEEEAETRREGRALLVAADRIRFQMKAQTGVTP